MYRLKKSYASREVAALTGLTAHQLRWWDRHGILSPAVPSHRTPAGGTTERRYSPTELLELVVLADLRRRGFSLARLRHLLDTLQRQFGSRLYDAIAGGTRIRLLTDGRDVFGRLANGQLVNLLQDSAQPLLAIGADPRIREISARLRARRRRRQKKAT